MSVGRTYDTGYSPDVEASVVELILDRNIKGQMSVLPDGDGFLIRLWPPNGTHEFGGTNGTALSMSMRFDDEGLMHLLHLQSTPDAAKWNPTPQRLAAKPIGPRLHPKHMHDLEPYGPSCFDAGCPTWCWWGHPMSYGEDTPATQSFSTNP